MSVGSGVYMSSALGLAAEKPMKYTNAVCIGLTLETIIAVLFNIVSDSMAQDSKIVVVLYFFLSIIVQIFCIVLEIGLKSEVMYFLWIWVTNT